MRASQFFISTLKEAPTDAEIISHRLMLRAGMIRKLAIATLSLVVALPAAAQGNIGTIERGRITEGLEKLAGQRREGGLQFLVLTGFQQGGRNIHYLEKRIAERMAWWEEMRNAKRR